MKNITNKTIFLFFFSFFGIGIQISQACDSCNFFEYSLLQNKSYFGLFYRYRGFQDYKSYTSFSPTTSKILNFPQQLSIVKIPGSLPEVMHEPEGNNLYVQKSKQDFETYQTLELRGNFTIKNRWNFTAVLPYEFNKVYYENYLDLPRPSRDTTLFVQGWGDLTLATDYIWLIYREKSRHTIRPGFAMTLPTGEAWVHSSNESSDLFDPIIQPGKNAFSLIPRINYQWFKTTYGINAGISYQFSTEGAQNYQSGQSLNAYLIYFYQINASSKMLLAPNAGFYVESAKKDLWSGVKQDLTGGNITFAQLGIDLNFTQTTINLVFQKPISQNLNGNQILHGNRISAGIIRNFKL